MASYKRWQVIRRRNGQTEMLDTDKDLWYYSGTPGFKTKAEANARAIRYGQDSSIKLMGPKGAFHRVVWSAKPKVDTAGAGLRSLVSIERSVETDDERWQFNQMLRNFVNEHGIYGVRTVEEVATLIGMLLRNKTFSFAELEVLLGKDF